MLGGGGGAGGGSGSGPDIRIDAGDVDVIYLADSYSDLGEPRLLPAIAVTRQDGLFLASEDSEFSPNGDSSMEEVDTIHVAQSYSELDETDAPAIALTADDGVFINLEAN
jgi:hypothetical protein